MLLPLYGTGPPAGSPGGCPRDRLMVPMMRVKVRCLHEAVAQQLSRRLESAGVRNSCRQGSACRKRPFCLSGTTWYREKTPVKARGGGSASPSQAISLALLRPPRHSDSIGQGKHCIIVLQGKRPTLSRAALQSKAPGPDRLTDYWKGRVVNDGWEQRSEARAGLPR